MIVWAYIIIEGYCTYSWASQKHWKTYPWPKRLKDFKLKTNKKPRIHKNEGYIPKTERPKWCQSQNKKFVPKSKCLCDEKGKRCPFFAFTDCSKEDMETINLALHIKEKVSWNEKGDLDKKKFLEFLKKLNSLKDEDTEEKHVPQYKYWSEYIKYNNSGCIRPKEEQKKLNKIKTFLDKNKKWQGSTGRDYSLELYNKIKKMSGLAFTARGWGALMAAYMNTKTKKRKYMYTNFYWL